MTRNSGHDRSEDDVVFKALADATRRSILDALRASPQTTGELCAMHPEMTRFGVMDHLSVLVDAGLVLVRRRGRERVNHLNPVPVQRIHDRWISRYAGSEAVALLRLQGAVEAVKDETAAPRQRRDR